MMAPPKTLAAAAVRPNRMLIAIGCIEPEKHNSTYNWFQKRDGGKGIGQLGLALLTPSAERAAHHHPLQCSPSLPAAVCLWSAHWLRNQLPATGPNGSFPRE